jgi:hypothetical protein
VRNNIVVGSNGGKASLLAFESKGSGENQLDYNRWYRQGDDGRGEPFVWKGPGFETLAEFQNATGQAAHSSWGDPGLRDEGYGLEAGSACIDAGDPSYWPQPGVLGFDGKSRLSGARVDLGANEVSADSR